MHGERLLRVKEALLLASPLSFSITNCNLSLSLIKCLFDKMSFRQSVIQQSVAFRKMSFRQNVPFDKMSFRQNVLESFTGMPEDAFKILKDFPGVETSGSDSETQ